MELRDYQIQTHLDLRKSVASGNRRIVVQAPTGAGKTVIGANVLHEAEQKGSPCLFFAHRRELVYQTVDKLAGFGVDHGMIMSGEFIDTAAPVQVCSVDTFRARVMRRGAKMRWPDARVVMIDECHRSLSKTYLQIMEHYWNAGSVIIGLTATPMRSDGRGLGLYFDDMVQTIATPELIHRGYLVEPKHYAPSIPDLTGVKTRSGDYAEDDLQDVMDKENLVGDIVTNWMRVASDRKTVVFATGVRHSIHLRDEFRKHDVAAEHIDGTTPAGERDRIINDLRSGKVQVITNCMVLTEGFDCPDLSCCVLARPTKNYGLYVQMGGRVLRSAEGKKDAIILDHSGAVYRHGKLDEPHPWSLEDEGRLEKDVKAQMKVREKTTITCESCNHVYGGQIQCPECGHTPERKGRAIVSKTGDLVAVEDAKNPPDPKKWRRHERVRWFNMFLKYAKEKGYKRGWAHHKYKQKFKEWPKSDYPEAPHIELSREFHAYMRHLQIRRAKQLDKEKRQSESDELDLAYAAKVAQG